MERSADIVIFGAGIAGLWNFHRLKRMGYNVLLLEKEAIGCGQTIASQGIIHSGLKYAVAGKVNALARSISAMPLKWRAALRGEGPVNLSDAKTLADSQLLLIPQGVLGGITKIVTQKILGSGVREIAPEDWPKDVKKSGFQGTVVFMDEIVLDMPSVIHALSEPYKDSIRKITDEEARHPLEFLKRHRIEPKKILFTGAVENHPLAEQNGHNAGLQTQKRPLLMGMMKPAPYPLYAHCIGKTDKPVVTITTHKDKDGELVWYLGALVAERKKDAAPDKVYSAAIKAFKKYLPHVDVSQAQWAVLPIDRSEGKSKTDGWMPDTPTVHHAGNTLYCWPTKMTFAPMLGDMIVEELEKDGLKPSNQNTDWSFLPEADYTPTPWDAAQWTKRA